ncbi:hypothetical protein D9M71_742650 [compost metagenome]
MLGGGDKTQADLVADQAGQCADAERHAVEQWVEYAWMATELTDTLFAPGQVVNLFFGRVLHGLAHLWQLGGQGLALVQRLGADFTGMVDTHEAGYVAGLGIVQGDIRLDDGR